MVSELAEKRKIKPHSNIDLPQKSCKKKMSVLFNIFYLNFLKVF